MVVTKMIQTSEGDHDGCQCDGSAVDASAKNGHYEDDIAEKCHNEDDPEVDASPENGLDQGSLEIRAWNWDTTLVELTGETASTPLIKE